MKFRVTPGAKVDIVLVLDGLSEMSCPLEWPANDIGACDNVELNFNDLPFHRVQAIKFLFPDESTETVILTPPEFDQSRRITPLEIDWWNTVLKAKASFTGKGGV